MISSKTWNFIIPFFIFSLIFMPLLNLISSGNSFEFSDNKIHSAAEKFYEEEWITNRNFTTPDSWYITKGSLGDPSDLEAEIDNGEAKFIIYGEKRLFSNINGTPQNSDWIPMKKAEESIYPDLFEINENGCNASHEYWEGTGNNLFGVPGNQTRNRPSVLWKRLIKMPHNMSDYIITASDLIAIFNGTANYNVETPNDTLTGTNPTRAENDHTKFYVQLTNLEDKIRYEAASYEPIYLGNGSLDANINYGSIDSINDTYMTSAPEDVLNYFLNRVFEYDYQNFSVILGIDIDCEDNYGQTDRDTYYSLLIKTCNLTFNYERKIDQLSNIAWNQICKEISDISNYSVIITDARLNFKYKINETWTETSPNSEIQILVNENKHPETIKLSSATSSFQEAKIGGFDIKNLITDDVNLSLQVYIADNFALNKSREISIDDVSLMLSYIIIEPDELITEGEEWIWVVYFLVGALIGLVGIFSIYQTHFKYPPMVRKVRKLKKKIKKGKDTKPFTINSREEIIKAKVEKNMQTLDLEKFQDKKKIDK
ncbi:MAG: hypothetical protein EU552_01330 [Promethearchaeota archaeon]|nr:MAG: hypothetical protein EU552_01330 [Candidatus Lokiarchaeota archaeon]